MSDKVYIGTHDRGDEYIDLNGVALELLNAHVRREGLMNVSAFDVERAFEVAAEFVERAEAIAQTKD